MVARGITRKPSGDYRTGSALAPVGTSYLSWRALALYLSGNRFVQKLRASGIQV
jgi:hypothetical protein